MSDDERMDRARRIRQMREGRRGGDPEEESTPEDGQSGAEDEAADPVETTATDQSTEVPVSDQSTVDTEQSAGRTEPEPPTGTTNGDGSQTGAVSAEATSSDAGTADGSEIEGPASTDEWFEDGDTETTGSASTEQVSTDGEDVETTQTAAAAASAAAAFEVDEDEQRANAATADTSGDAEEGEAEAEQEEEIRVLEFRLGEEHYCLDIEYVEEIVKEESVTRVPNTPAHVHGVVDLRGQITTILDPKIALDIQQTNDEQLIVVFDANTFEDQGHAGWIVDEVRQVLPITESEVKESPLDRKSIKGVIERDEEFVIWTTPQVALEQAEE